MDPAPSDRGKLWCVVVWGFSVLWLGFFWCMFKGYAVLIH